MLTIPGSALHPVATKSRFLWSQTEIIQKSIMTQIARKTAISMRVSSKLQPPIARLTMTDPPRHCVGEHEETQCTREDHEYNVPLRIGLLFVILVTSAIGVFLPILLTSFTRLTQTSIVFVILKQFGTGIVISTAFVHVRRPIFAWINC
jgi:VIT1/CCC1 family predicted Fe2+/Mn2+ transporter